MENEEEMTCRILPKGVILLALGGYMKEEAHEQACEIDKRLTEYLERNHCIIAPIDGKLDFLDIKQ